MTLKINERGNADVGQLAERPRFRSMGRGFLCRCPACNTGALFSGYLTVIDRCKNCSEELHHQRADDAPAYFTITIVAHLVIPAVIAAELAWQWSYWLHALVWLPVTLALTFWLMPRVKGAIVGLQWALRMHDFGGGDET